MERAEDTQRYEETIQEAAWWDVCAREARQEPSEYGHQRGGDTARTTDNLRDTDTGKVAQQEDAILTRLPQLYFSGIFETLANTLF